MDKLVIVYLNLGEYYDVEFKIWNGIFVGEMYGCSVYSWYEVGV